MGFFMHRRTGVASLAVASITLGLAACSGGGSSASVAPPPADPVVSVAVVPADLFLIVDEAGGRLRSTLTTRSGGTSPKTVQWTSSDPSVAEVDAAGNVRGVGHGSATITARVDGVSATAAIEVRDRPPPPPPSGLHYAADLSAIASDADLAQLIDVATPGNIHADPSRGMRYDFQSFPNRCGDQSLTSRIGLPAGTREIWVRFRIRFSTNWKTENANCESPDPDYKTLLTWVANQGALEGGTGRFDFNTGSVHGDDIHASVPGYPQHDAVGLNVVRQPGSKSLLYDGRWHTVEIHQAVIGDNEAVFQVRIDNELTHNYRTETAKGLFSVWLSRINLGSNRNLGATSLMRVWWDDVEVYVGDDPGGFDFPEPTSH